MNAAAEKIMKANPDIRITVAGGGSGLGVQKAGEGLVQIGNAGRALSAEEVAEYGLVSFPFAVDGVCTVVHPENPLGSITSQQLQDIFAGRITNWKELGGSDHEIHLFTRDEASGTRKVYWSKALAKAEIAASANVVASNGAMKTAVGKDPYAIGYVSIGHLDASLKAPDLDGVAVTQENAADGTYPVTRKLYMNTKGEPEGLTRAFIDYILGEDGAGIIVDAGYLPVGGK
jgi:phosphate transport system substrate-binding protein